MKEKSATTAFYLETLLLVLAFAAMVLTMARMFGVARARSREAGVLTNAVCLAENAAEAFSASTDPETLAALLDEGGNVRQENGQIVAGYNTDMSPNVTGEPPLRLTVTWESSTEDARFVTGRIDVRDTAGAAVIYHLDTAVFLPGEAGA